MHFSNFPVWAVLFFGALTFRICILPLILSSYKRMSVFIDKFTLFKEIKYIFKESNLKNYQKIYKGI